ncbi:MAG: mechanosensitive ion channel family protein [Deltaproteobacteria bacterium]|nr:mechanosensitive ion channel family protein [Deltaproteobacteria bacterium]
MEQLRQLIGNTYALAGLIVVGSIIGAYIVAFVVERTLGALVRKTETDLDDKIIEHIHSPLVISTVLWGTGVAVLRLPLSDRVHHYGISFLKTLAIIIWARAGLKVVTLVLHALSAKAKDKDLIQPRTLPVFDMIGKLLVVGLAVYFCFLAWNIDLTAWLASAGIVGIAVGFAAKDTLANFFSGIFIVADAPYKIGDYIVLDGGMRGRVTSIGIRSTRLLTRDDIEITVPNAVIGASMIVNEAGGPSTAQRVGVTVDAAYGSDIDKVHKVLQKVPEGVPHLMKKPSPVVRFQAFGASGLTHTLYVWVTDAEMRELVLHILHTKIYKAFEEAGLEIPYSKHDVYIKELPAGEKPGLRATG